MLPKKSGPIPRIFLVCFALLGGMLPLITFSQPAHKDLRIIGSSVPFVFNTWAQFNGGITLTGWTRIQIQYQYSGHNAWELNVNTSDAHLRYEGDSTYDIPVDELLLTVRVISSNDLSLAVGTETPLQGSVTPQIIAAGDGLNPPETVNVELLVSYQIGVPPNIMLGRPGGVYYVQLELLLKEQI